MSVLLVLPFALVPTRLQDPSSSPTPERLRKAIELYRRFPPPKWGLHVVREIQQRKKIGPILTPEEREFIQKIELWVHAHKYKQKQEVARLVELLGSEEVAKRDRAFTGVMALGGDALPGLEVAKDHEDPNVRLRVRELIETIRRSVADKKNDLDLELFVRPDGRVEQGGKLLPWSAAEGNRANWEKFFGEHREMVKKARGASAGDQRKFPLRIAADRSTPFEYLQTLLMAATKEGGVTRIQLREKEGQKGERR